MRFIISILVAMVLTHMAFYVLANMNNAEYSMNTATIVGVIVGILAILAGETTVSEKMHNAKRKRLVSYEPFFIFILTMSPRSLFEHEVDFQLHQKQLNLVHR